MSTNKVLLSALTILPRTGGYVLGGAAIIGIIALLIIKYKNSQKTEISSTGKILEKPEDVKRLPEEQVQTEIDDLS